MEPPFVEIYEELINGIETLGISAVSVAQDIPKTEPFARVQLLNANGNQVGANVRDYLYPFQIDIITDKNSLAKGLTIAYEVMELCRRLTVQDYAVGLSEEPSLSSMVDTSLNRVLNRQIIRPTFTAIERATF